jgi:subtilisin
MATDPRAGGELFILLPSRGLKAARGIERDLLTRFGGITSTGPAARLSQDDFFRPVEGRLPTHSRRRGPASDVPTISIIDSVREDGPKLVRMSPETADMLAEADTGLRPIRVRYYEPALAPTSAPHQAPVNADAAAPLVIRVEDAEGRPVAGAHVIAHTRLAQREGAEGITDASGMVPLSLGASPVALESLFIDAPARDLWGLYRSNVPLRNGDTLRLDGFATPLRDCVRSHCSPFRTDDGAGVRIAVIDSGVGPHPELVVSGGRNTVQGEDRDLIADNGLGHGTHVAGIIGARAQPGGAEGVAQAADLWSGRVYGAGQSRATNFAILKAMMLATDADCDLLNLSLSSGEPDPALQDAVTDAAQSGAVVLVATGNTGQPAVGVPARCVDAFGISAFGIAGTFPSAAGQACEVGSPAYQANFFAAFANYGPEVRLTGPGVGVCSTALGGGYAIRSGTSMACAAISAMAARLLAGAPSLLAARRDIARSTAIQNLLLANARSLSFGFRHEGSGTL